MSIGVQVNPEIPNMINESKTEAWAERINKLDTSEDESLTAPLTKIHYKSEESMRSERWPRYCNGLTWKQMQKLAKNKNLRPLREAITDAYESEENIHVRKSTVRIRNEDSGKPTKSKNNALQNLLKESAWN